MESIVPAISSGTEGPLGLKHLPRLWLKTLLAACGRLPEGYKATGPGFDYMILEGLGLDPDEVREYIFAEKPSYLAFEAWIREHPDSDTSPENIAKVNQAVEERNKAPESRAKMLEENGLPEDAPIYSSIMLNNLDDWREIYIALGLE